MLIAILLVGWILSFSGIWKIGKSMPNQGFIFVVILLIIPVAVCCLTGAEKKWIKYFIMFFCIMAAAAAEPLMPNYSVILSIIPLIYSGMYASKKTLYFTYIITVVSIAVSLFAACISKGGEINRSAVYLILSRIFFVTAFVPIIYKFSELIGRMKKIQKIAERDIMTGLWNKYSFQKAAEKRYRKLKRIAVIYFDINSLKNVNDTYGHVKGDCIINAAASCVAGLEDERSEAYRMGGDEFLLVISDGSSSDAEKKLDEWRKDMEIKEKNLNIHFSVSAGYSAGEGSRIDELINEADNCMYEDKKRYHLKVMDEY